MKALFRICFILLLCFYTSCQGEKESTELDKIPMKDRFIYQKGDKLMYQCNDGTTDTVFVKDYLFWTISGSGTDMFGASHGWKRDQQRITIESTSDRWNKALGIIFESESFTSNCFIIDTPNSIYDTNDNPYSCLISGCNYGAGLPIFADGGVTISALSFNNNSFEKVYTSSRNIGANSFKIYWNLKYGLIRYEYVIEGKQTIWDLDSPKM